jgi:hypothetical protein
VKRKTKPCPRLAETIVSSQAMGMLSDGRGEKVYVKWCCEDIPEYVCIMIQMTNFASTNIILLVDKGVVINAIHHPSYCPTCCHLPLTNTPTLGVFCHQTCTRKRHSERLNIASNCGKGLKNLSKHWWHWQSHALETHFLLM